jgi:hypothetical protein
MKVILILFALAYLAATNVKAQSAIAVFKPTIGGDEHYGFSTGSSESEAKTKSMKLLDAMVSQKVAQGTSGEKFILRTTDKKGWYAVARGKDQYGHYWHYDAAMGYDSEAAARTAVRDILSGRGLYNIEILSSADDE